MGGCAMISLISRDGFWVRVSESKPNTPEEIAESIINNIVICSGYSKSRLMEDNRKIEIRTWRQIGMYIMRKKNIMSLKTIGRQFGGRNHATVIHASERIQDLIDSNDPIVMEKFAKLSHIIHICPSNKKPYGVYN